MDPPPRYHQVGTYDAQIIFSTYAKISRRTSDVLVVTDVTILSLSMRTAQFKLNQKINYLLIVALLTTFVFLLFLD